MPFRAIHIALSIDNVLYIATACTYILIGEQCKNSTASVQPPRISRTRQSTTECNTPINRAPARAARWTNRCRGGIAASMQKPPVRATHKRAQTGGFPTAASYAEIRSVRHMLPRSHPAGNLPQAASGIESPAADACGRPSPARWPCQSGISQMSIDIRSDILTSASRCPAAGCRRSRTGRSWPDPSSHRGTKPGWRPG